MLLEKIIEIMEDWAPESTQIEGDHSGLQVGDRKDEIKAIVLSLDCDRGALEFAKENRANLIIAHHPFIYGVLNKMDFKGKTQRLVAQACKYDINVYSSHTNLDKADDGVNDALAEKIGMEDPKKFLGLDLSMGRWDDIEPISAKDLALKAKEALKTPYVQVFGNPDSIIERLAVVGGSGTSMRDEVFEIGADALLTGEVKYHDYRAMVDDGMVLLDCGHYPTERPVLEKIEARLKEKGVEIPILIYNQYEPRSVF